MAGKRLSALLLSALLLITASGCGQKDPPAESVSTPDVSEPVVSTPASSSSSSQPDQSEPAVSVIAPVTDPEPVLPYTNPLTGEGCETDISMNRPIAIMLNNHKDALPQLGVSRADIIYEFPAEGGITRMMGVFQDISGVGNLGSVRSARDYYISMAYGMDAIFLHAGGSPQAYTVIKQWGVPALDCVNGPYEGTLYWRDAERRKNAGLEHSVLTSSDKIQELFPTYNLRTEHKEGYSYPMSFAEDATPATGVSAETITVKFSTYKTGVFRYDSESGLYLVEEYGQPYMDGNTNEQMAVKNVLILSTDVSLIKGDTAGRLSVRTTGTGTGKFACGGKIENITWSKESHSSPMKFYNTDGTELQFGIGTTYINVIGGTASYGYE